MVSSGCSHNNLKLIERITIAFSIIIAILLVLIGTSKHGLGLTGDSMNYLALSENLLNGKGVVGMGGTSFVLWPPGYSIIISGLLAITNSDAYSILTALNLVSLTATIILSSLLFRQTLLEAKIRFYGSLLLVLAPGVYLIWVFAFVETVFVPILLLFLFLCQKWRNNLSISRVCQLSLISLTLFFLKYIGIVTLPIILYLIYKGNTEKKLQKYSFGVLISLFPAILWVVKNYLVSGTPFGLRGSSLYGLFEVLFISIETFLYWVFPVVMLLTLTIFLFLGLRKESDSGGSNILSKIDIHLLFIGLFLIVTFISSTISAFDRLNNRLLFPIFIPLLIVCLVSVEQLKLRIEVMKKKKVMFFFGIILMSIPVLAYIRTDIRSFNSRILNGAGGISTDEYQAHLPRIPMEVIDRLKSERSVYSNGPELLYYATTIQSKKAPRKFYYNSTTVEVEYKNLKNFFGNEKSLLVWLGDNNSDLSYSPEELKQFYNLRLNSSGKEYRIYEISVRK